VTRTPRLLAGCALAALVLTGCGDGTIRTGAAATVGDERITTTTLNRVVDKGLSDPGAQQTVGGDRAQFERSVLARLIQHQVLVAAAKAEGVTVTGAQKDAARAAIANQLGGDAQLVSQAAKAGFSAEDLDQAIADTALKDALGDKLTASVPVPEAALRADYAQNIAQYDRVHSAHILVASQALAQRILAQVKADPSQFAALAARYSTDPGSKDSGGDLGFQGRGALEKPFETAIFAARPGSFVLARTRYGFHVIHVIARQTTTFEQATPQLRRDLLGQERQDAVSRLLVATAKKLGVHVNPRFGTWHPSDETVVATVSCPDTAVSSPSPRPGDTAPATDPSASPACP
jgi:parvulin-like peptidyl-prolyl isomerase